MQSTEISDSKGNIHQALSVSLSKTFGFKMFRAKQSFMEKKQDNRRTIGSLGEEIAAKYLLSQKYRLISRNYQKPWGEIDLIAEKKGVIIFFEVKTSSREDGWSFAPELRVNSQKARHLVRTAKIFMQDSYRNKKKEWRIDIISVILNKLTHQAKLKHFKNVLVDPA